MGERKGTKGLELWCKRMTEGYPGVKIENMTTSWRDGLAFCAMIHHFRPDLIDFSKLNKGDVYNNNEMAFRIAEDHLGIPALLEPEDMVEFPVPDRLSILTYLSQFYQAFAVNQSNSPSKTPTKRPPPADLQMHVVSATSSSPPKKAALRILGARREPCAKCGLPVFIAERLNVGKALYHRTCFRCARCDSQLTLANYYETESNEFCCETCPDEEKSPKINSSILSKSLSDEEKSASLKEESDLYSANVENVLEDSRDNSLIRNFTLDRVLGTQFIKARSDFMTTQVESSDSESDSSDENKPPDLPALNVKHTEQYVVKHNENMDVVSSNKLPSFSDSGFPSSKLNDQNLYESQDLVTKDSILAKEEPASFSIKSRIKLFESDVGDQCKIPKSDVNREFLMLSEKIDQVPYEETSKEASVNSEQCASESCEKNLLEHSDIRVTITSPVKDSSVVTIEESEENTSICSLNYEADVSNNCLLNELNASVSTESSQILVKPAISNNEHADNVLFGHKDVSDDSMMNEQNESVIVISSESSSEKGNSVSSPSDQIEELEEVKETSVIVISDTSEAKSDSPLSEKPSKKTSQESEKVSVEEKGDTSSVIQYPDDLNPFGDDEIEETSKSVSLNPFGDTDDEEEESEKKKTVVSPRLIVPVKSTNPFESDDDDDEKVESLSAMPPQPAVRKIIKAPRTTLTPYWFEGEAPVPKPRSTTRSPSRSTSDASSLTGSGRKKKPAPKPPTSSVFGQETNESPMSSIASSPSQSVCHSPKPTPKNRKMRRAPQPPGVSTPLDPRRSRDGHTFATLSPIGQCSSIADNENKPLQFRIGSEENLKSAKDEMNRNKQYNSNLPSNEGPSSLPNKSTYGKWKRRKGQAPSRPIPQKRSIKSLPIDEIKHELELIETQQSGLEKQGVKLEKLIRERSEVPGTNEDEALAPEVEDMVLQLFELVNEKNELFRKQAELMYLRRQHRLEEEHAEVEYQIRCIMLQPEANKTDSDKAKEEELIARLLEIVERRNEIVDCLEMDRRREVDEDTSISNQMSLFSLQRDESATAKKKSNKKEKIKTKKSKEKKSKSKNQVDADKDIDESETPDVKDKKKKKKFNLF